jgi:hypothetical protein
MECSYCFNEGCYLHLHNLDTGADAWYCSKECMHNDINDVILEERMLLDIDDKEGI